MKILVTGGAGFIGSCVVRTICNDGTHDPIVVDKLTYAGNLNSLPQKFKNDTNIFLQFDICDDQLLERAFFEHKPDSIMHLAAESHVDRSIDDPDDFLNTNIIGTYKLLQVSLKYYRTLKGNKKENFIFHHVSTDEVFGDLKNIDELFTETTSYSPSSPYSASKASSDHLVRAWYKTYGLPVVITNCSNNYGPYHFPEKLIPHTILSAIKGKPIPIYGDGSQIRDWLYVEDHAKALIEVIERGKPGETYNIGGFNEKTNIDVVIKICECLENLGATKPLGLKYFKDLITFVEDRPGHDQRYAIDATKIKKELGWTPNETFDTGIEKTVRWYLKNEAWWKDVLSGNYKLNRVGLDINE